MGTDLGQIPDTEEDFGEDEKLSSQPFTEEQKSKEKNIKQLLKDSQYRQKLLRTLWISLTFLTLGLSVGLNGPTFLDLQIITNTDLEKASAFFTGGSIGYLIGSLISGAIYSKVNKNILFFCAAFALGGSLIVTPYCSSYPLMIGMRAGGGILSGVIDTTGNAEHMRIWGSDGAVLMQLLHFVFAFGGIMSPLYSAPYLAERVSDTKEDINGSSPNQTQLQTTMEPLQPQETDVKYPFIITGSFAILTSIPFFVLFIKDKIEKKTVASTDDKKVTQRKMPQPLFIFILVTICSFYMLYCCVEDTFASFLLTFVVEEYFPLVTKSKGAYMTAIYWASFAASRFIMIFVSNVLKAVHLLYLCCSLMIISYLCFFISATFGAIAALSVFSALAGLSMSAVFPAGFSWTEAELIRVTGPVSSCILVSASLGTMVNPLLLAYLMEELDSMWFCYVLLAETIMMSAVFLFLLIFNRVYVNKHYGSMACTTMELETSVAATPSLNSSDPKTFDDNTI